MILWINYAENIWYNIDDDFATNLKGCMLREGGLIVHFSPGCTLRFSTAGANLSVYLYNLCLGGSLDSLWIARGLQVVLGLRAMLITQGIFMCHYVSIGRFNNTATFLWCLVWLSLSEKVLFFGPVIITTGADTAVNCTDTHTTIQWLATALNFAWMKRIVFTWLFCIYTVRFIWLHYTATCDVRALPPAVQAWAVAL